MSKVLITGGCGYIGSHTILETLKNTSYEVVSIDNHVNSNDDSLNTIKEVTGKEITNYAIDLRDLEATKKVFIENPDIEGIIHFAALKSVPESVEKPLLYYDNNNNSLINILKCAVEFQVKNVIFSSSCSVYGNVDQLPVVESTPLNEAESAYGNSKQMGEQIIKHFCASSDVNVIALRYFNPVGAVESGIIGENPINSPTTLVPVICLTAVGKIPELTVFGGDYDTRDGTCIRDYVHVCDIADAHIDALNYLFNGKNKSNFEIFNLGSGNGVTVLEAINAFEKVSGVKLNYRIGDRREGDVAAIYSDSNKALKALGWSAKRDIETMMSSAWKWQQNIS